MVANWVGRSLIVIGALTLLFVAFQLWGTGFVQAQEQDALKDEIEQQLAGSEHDRAGDAGATATTTSTSSTTTALSSPAPGAGEALGVLEIPAVGVDQAIVEGVDRDSLRKGPGHYPHSPLPGHAGNVSIAGHRTTYGAPFFDLDRLAPGDEIHVETLEGRFTYVVREQLVTAPDDVSVISATEDDRLTLTTCNPKYSAAERLIVVAELRGDPVDAPEPEPSESSGSSESSDGAPTLPGEPSEGPAAHLDGLDGSAASGLGSVDAGTGIWTGAVLLVGGLWWLLFHTRPRWYTWVAGAMAFLAVLFFFFGQVEELLPANF